MSGDFICVLRTPSGLCCNCGDEGILLRGEQPILNAKGLTFCSVECADEFDTRTEREELKRATEWCHACGYDNHEHASDCTLGAVLLAAISGRSVPQ